MQLIYNKEVTKMGKKSAEKVVRRRDNGDDDGNWTELTFERKGAQVKYTSPTLKASKHGIALYKTSFVGEQSIRIFRNGAKIGIIADEEGAKKLKSNKSNTRVTIAGKNVVRELKLEGGAILGGYKGTVQGKEAWIFG